MKCYGLYITLKTEVLYVVLCMQCAGAIGLTITVYFKIFICTLCWVMDKLRYIFPHHLQNAVSMCCVTVSTHHLLNALSMCCVTVSTSPSECCLHMPTCSPAVTPVYYTC